VLSALRVELARTDAAEGAPADTWIRIAHVGEWRGHHAGAFALTSEHLDSIVATFDAQADDLVLDYEHASVYAGREAPAAGWIDALERRGDDLYAHVTLTKRAREYVLADEYRHVSPVIWFDEPDAVTGEPIPAQLHSVALTNTPFLDGLGDVELVETLRAASRRAASQTTAAESAATGGQMDAEKAVAIVSALMSKLGVSDPDALEGAIAELVGAGAEGESEDAPKSMEAARRKIAASRSALDGVIKDRDALAKRVEELESERLDRLVDDDVRAGRLLPAERDTYRALAAKDPETYRKITATRRAIPGGTSTRVAARHETKSAPASGDALDPKDPVVRTMRAAGLSDERIRRALAKRAAATTEG